MSAAALIMHSILLGVAVILASFIVGWSVVKSANKLADAASQRSAMESAPPAPMPPIHITVAAPPPPPPAPIPADVPEVVESEPAATNMEEEGLAVDATRAIEPLPELDSLLLDDRARGPGEEDA
jgi:hypothetical protein